MDRDGFLTASGAIRDVQQELDSSPADPLDARPGPPGSKVLTYRYLDLPGQDTRGVIGYLQRAFTQCAQAKPWTTVAGVVALKGTTSSDLDPKMTAECVLLVSERRVGWVVLDGSGWTNDDRTRALQVVATYAVTTP